MRKIGNIVFDKNANESSLFDIVGCVSDIAQPTLPTLVVGWNNVSKLFPSQSIVESCIDSNKKMYWTFGRREKRSKYESDISSFRDFALKEFIAKIRYEFIDILTCDKECKKWLFGVINGKHGKTVSYVYDNMFYINIVGCEFVYGINLFDIEYEGKSSDDIINMAKLSRTNKFIENVPISIIRMFNKSLFSIPYLYSE